MIRRLPYAIIPKKNTLARSCSRGNCSRAWLEHWVPQLAQKTIRAVSYEEFRRIWARFEELHPDAEENDVMHICRQLMLEIESGAAELIHSRRFAGAE
jgi:hypothetical protein